ncbi:MAG TPA: fused MFS/spermidine synthase [Pseudolabrys sp.]|nr:fused MFS/spermidine synthase [Pseudolabrys sp.]
MARSSSHPIPLARGERLVLGLFTAAVFVSALLLFGVQPMFSRMVLPQLGGSPSVWSVAMVFFQSMLLAGYAYAHILAGMQNRRLAVGLHLALLTGALFMLPLSIADWGAPPASGTALWLLGLFTVSIGLPFFALAANNPLLQTWFVRTGHREGSDPYFLYAASNIGSFLALLSYPLLLEPAFTLHTQGWLWSGGFVLLVALIGSCGLVMLRSGADAVPGAQVRPPGAKPAWLLTGRWVFLSTVPSGLLVAVTAHISTELTSAPLLWVIPLSLYLLTWVVVFQRKPVLSHDFVLALQPFAVAAIVALLYLGNRVPMVPSLIGHLLAFFIIAMGCHGELARTRPAAAYLSSFYVSLSFGGMLGGLFAGLLAPYMFSWVAEYPILVALAVLCRPWTPVQRNEIWFWLAAGATSAFVVFAFLPVDGRGATVSQLDMAVLGLAVLSMLFMREVRKSAAIVVLALIVTHTQHTGYTSIRSFFGVNVVFDYDKRFRILRHGSTIHGAEQLIDGRPVPGRPKPLTYYHDGAPITKAIEAVRARKAGPLRVAVIGLGAGALACRIMPNETWRFFEIDQTVIDIARDPKYFTFLSRCAPDLPVVLGDARLTMAGEPAGFYDVIVVDAYSSDAIPVHLATREAMALYKSRLAPHGVIVMHISNRHLELESVATGIAAANGMQTWLWNDPRFGTNILELISPSYVAVAAERPEDVGTIATSERWTLTAPDPGERVWTDDYSNIAGAFWRKLRQRWAEPAGQ